MLTSTCECATCHEWFEPAQVQVWITLSRNRIPRGWQSPFVYICFSPRCQEKADLMGLVPHVRADHIEPEGSRNHPETVHYRYVVDPWTAIDAAFVA